MGCGYISVICSDGQVMMWGDNYAGQLGQEDDVHRDTPVVVKSLTEKKIIK